VLNGTANDTAAIQAALDSIVTVDQDGYGLRVQMPEGTAGLGSVIYIPNRVKLVGLGRRGPFSFKMLSSFSGTTALILGKTSDTLAFDCGLEHMRVDCNSVASSVAVSSTKLQEGGGLDNVLLTNWTSRGLSLPSGNANYRLAELELYSAGGAAQYALYLNDCAGHCRVSGITVVGGGGNGVNNLTTGIYLDSSGAAGLILHGIHVENCVTGIYFDCNDAAATVDTVSMSLAVTTIVRTRTARPTIHNIIKGTATNAIVDDLNGYTTTDSFVPEYASQSRLRGEVLVPNAIGSSANAIVVDADFGSFQRCNTLTENTTVGSPSNSAAGKNLIFRFVQDGTGGRTVTWNAIFHGVTLAASGTANQRALIEFFNDGTYWIQKSSSGWVA
jgi:hypothetical protein